MSRAPVIARRELSGYFFSPIAYVAMGLFLLACGAAFWSDFVPGQPVEMRQRIGENLLVDMPGEWDVDCDRLQPRSSPGP